jgi:hypothetical protein
VCISKCSNFETLPASCDNGKPNADEVEGSAGVTPRNLNFQLDGDDVSGVKNTAKEAEQFTQTTDSNDDEEEVSDVTPIGNLPGATISEADLKMMTVYGDFVHQNDGTHLDGGVGRRFIRILTKELDGIVSQKWNSE